MGDRHELEHRAAPAPEAGTAVPLLDAPVQAQPTRPVPGLAVPPPVRRKGPVADPLGGSAVDPAVEQVLRQPTGGASLPAAVQGTMGGLLDTDFSDVQVHTDSTAAQASAAVGATAFTHGRNIFFSQGSYDPGSEAGQELLAHELTHVVQQKQGRDTGGVAASGATTVGRADDPLELEADAVARDVVGALRRQTKGCGCGQE